MKLEALTFDVDGTLVDTEELHRQAYNQTFMDFGFGWEWDARCYADLLTVSGGQARIARYIDLIDLPPAEKLRLRRVIPAVHQEKTRLYGEMIAGDSVKLRPGIGRLIDEARNANIRIGLVASSASANVDPMVSAALGDDRRKAVIAIVCGDMVARKKPAPDMYELLLSMLRVSASTTVAFEDSSNGIAAAKAVGLFTVCTPSRWTLAQEAPGADLILSSLGDPNDPVDTADAAKIGGRYLELSKLETLRSRAGPGLKLSEVGS